jgi:hypothetical protein
LGRGLWGVSAGSKSACETRSIEAAQAARAAGRTLLEGFLNTVGDGATEDDNIEERVGAEPVSAVDGHASSLTSSHKARNNGVGVVA